MLKITNEVPTSWKDLQDKVCKYLNQAGYHAVSPKTIKLVRGDVEVDVFVTAKEELLKQFICECKFWDTPVPKEKIHAFRTVVQDSGSMLGIFISKNGYQKGALEAAYERMSCAVNPYGDCKACDRIVKALKGEKVDRYEV